MTALFCVCVLLVAGVVVSSGATTVKEAAGAQEVGPAAGAQAASTQAAVTPAVSDRCKNQPDAPPRIEKTITECQNDIKRAILQEVLSEVKRVNQVKSAEPARRGKRDTFENDEKRIAGCLLHCVYRKVKAVDANGFPTLEGLVRLYTEGVQEQDYFSATARGAHKCIAQQQRQALPVDGKQLCDVAYDVFECLTNHLDSYCKGVDE